jgi:hypothetical protein
VNIEKWVNSDGIIADAAITIAPAPEALDSICEIVSGLISPRFTREIQTTRNPIALAKRRDRHARVFRELIAGRT